MKTKDPRLVMQRDFQCVVCGLVAPATKFARKTGAGHIKHMWCVCCEDITEHVQIISREWDERKMKITVRLNCTDMESLESDIKKLESLASRFPRLRFEVEVEIGRLSTDGNIRWMHI